jgi:hypothetical protein
VRARPAFDLGGNASAVVARRSGEIVTDLQVQSELGASAKMAPEPQRGVCADRALPFRIDVIRPDRTRNASARRLADTTGCDQGGSEPSTSGSISGPAARC